MAQKYTLEEFLAMLENNGGSSGGGSNNVGSPTGHSASVGGDTGMMDSFSQLGQDIQNQSNMQIDNIMKWTQMMHDQRDADADRAESKREFNIGTALKNREMNLGAQDFLANQRDKAAAAARVRQFRQKVVGA